jgi:hypothetical protein
MFLKQKLLFNCIITLFIAIKTVSILDKIKGNYFSVQGNTFKNCTPGDIQMWTIF